MSAAGLGWSRAAVCHVMGGYGGGAAIREKQADSGRGIRRATKAQHFRSTLELLGL